MPLGGGELCGGGKLSGRTKVHVVLHGGFIVEDAHEIECHCHRVLEGAKVGRRADRHAVNCHHAIADAQPPAAHRRRVLANG